MSRLSSLFLHVILTLLLVLLPTNLFAYNAWDPFVPTLQAGPTDRSPVIDGVVNSDGWNMAASTDTFHLISTETIISPAPKAFVTYDNDNLYVAIISPYISGNMPVAQKRERDGEIWNDDSFEIFIDPLHDTVHFFQFVVNAANSISDSETSRREWNGNWQVATSQGKDSWSAEFKIPFSTLGVSSPKNTTLMGLNICVDRNEKPITYNTWTPLLRGNFHQPDKFGHLILEPAGPSTATDFNFKDGSWVFNATANAEHYAGLTLTCDGKEIGKTRSEIKGATQLKLPAPVINGKLQPNDYQWKVEISKGDGGKVVFRHIGLTTIKSQVGLSLRKLFMKGELLVDIDTSGYTGQPKPESVDVSLTDKNGKELASKHLSNLVANKGTLRFDVSKYDAADYLIKATAKDNTGNQLATAQKEFTVPPKPVWLNSKAGVSDKVLAPWTPMKLTKKTNDLSVSMYGRKYTFSGMPFPSSIITRDKSIFNGPISLILSVNGKQSILKGDLKVVKNTPAMIVLDGIAKAGPLKAYSKVELEFDGNAFVDLKMVSDSAVTIDKMTLEIPFKKEHALYRYFFPAGTWNSSVNAGSLPAKGWEHDFVQYVWLGDNDRGFGVYAISDQYWNPGKTKAFQALHVDPHTVALRINIVSDPLKLTAEQAKSGIKYSLGFGATPVRKSEKDVWDYKLNHSGDYSLNTDAVNDTTELNFTQTKLLNPSQGTIDMWVKPLFDPNVIVDDTKDRGTYNRELMILSNPDEMISLYWNISDRGMRLFSLKGAEYPFVQGSTSDWKQNEYHHLAVTWGDAIRLYVDGKKAIEIPHKGLSQGIKDLDRFYLRAARNGFAIDELRVSDIAREPQMPTAPYVSDSHTLLLDHFDTIQDMKLGRLYTEPVKGPKYNLDMAASVVAGRFGKALGVSEQRLLRLDYLKQKGVKTIVFHEHWTDYQNSTETRYQEELKTLVKECHKRGMQLLLYFGYELSDIAPEWDLYHNECIVWPFWQSYTRNPQQKDYVVCYNSDWPDYLADGINRMIDKYDIDGVYLDSSAVPWGCANEEHGCGYARPDGTRGATYSFRGAREMIRRLYTLIKAKKPNGQVNLHNSMTMTMPAVAWATSSWDGEQFTTMLPPKDMMAILPLDTFRAEFMSRQWGVPSEMLCNDIPWTRHEMLSETLLHDVLVRCLGQSLEEESLLWKTMDNFGRKQAEFHPYFNNSNLVSVSTPGGYCSLYLRRGKGVMCVVSNLGKKAGNVKVKLNIPKTEIKSKVSAIDIFTGKSVPITNGAFSVDLNSNDYTLVWVK